MTERRECDFYITPMDLVTAACFEFITAYQPKANNVLDIGCGDGRWVHQYYYNSHYTPRKITGIDIRPKDVVSLIPGAVDEFIEADYSTYPFEMLGRTFDLIIGNIPYTNAEQTIRKAYSELNPGGYIVQLLRLGFLASQERIEFYKEMPPESIYVLSRRPSFTGSGTDGSEYAIYIWHKIDEALVPQIKWLEW